MRSRPARFAACSTASAAAIAPCAGRAAHSDRDCDLQAWGDPAPRGGAYGALEPIRDLSSVVHPQCLDVSRGCSGTLVQLDRLRVGHEGHLGSVPTQFVLLLVVSVTVFGLLAGWVKVRTYSLIGPALLYSAMNIVAVA
jgi:hypothetical protein